MLLGDSLSLFKHWSPVQWTSVLLPRHDVAEEGQRTASLRMPTGSGEHLEVRFCDASSGSHRTRFDLASS